jgi:L-amino acid N-acyltransferase YncA
VLRHQVEIARAQAEDMPDVLGLLLECHDELAQLGRPVLGAAQVSARLTEAIDSGTVEVVLARRDGRAAGLLILRESPVSFVEAQALCVDQFYVGVEDRQHGLGRALLSYVAGRAEYLGADQVVASVSPWDRDKHRFFARLGFAPLSLRRSVNPATLRRLLAGDARKGGLESLLSRRRSLRAKARRRPPMPIGSPLPMAGTPIAQTDH